MDVEPGSTGLKRCEVVDVKGNKIDQMFHMGIGGGASPIDKLKSWYNGDTPDTNLAYVIDSKEGMFGGVAGINQNYGVIHEGTVENSDGTQTRHTYHKSTSGRVERLCELETKVHKTETDDEIINYEDVSNIVRCGTIQEWQDAKSWSSTGAKAWTGDTRIFPAVPEGSPLSDTIDNGFTPVEYDF